MFKKIKISEYYKFVKGSNNYNKKTINNNQGNTPVYSGQAIGNGIIGYINNKDYSGTYLRIITVGDAGNVFIISGDFCLAQNNGILIPIKETDHEKINLEYIKFQLIEKLHKYAKGEGKQKSLLKQDIENFELIIPITESGDFDLEKQKEISKKYKILEFLKRDLNSYKNKLKNIFFDINLNQYNFIKLSVSEIFDLSISSNGSKFTKGFIAKNIGNIPVYGATKFPEEVGYGYVKDNAEIIFNDKSIPVKYFEDCLTYNIDGTAGYIFYREGRFSISEKVRPLIIKDKYKGMLDYEYLKFLLQPMFRKNTKGRKGPDGENEFSKISIGDIENLLVEIPIDNNGNIDLNTQKEIANKYIKLNESKINISKTLNKFLEVQLTLE